MQLFARRPGGDLDSAVERVVFIQQRQVCTPAAEEFCEHFAEVGLHLRKGVIKQFSGRRVNLRNHIEQLAARICKIIILCFEKFVALFEFVVLMNSIKVHRAHVIQLALEFFNELFDIWRSKSRRACRRRSSAL